MKYETLDDLFPDTIPTVNDIYNALKNKLKEDPNYEVWAPLVYHRSNIHIRKNIEVKTITTDNILISNKGRLLSLRKGKKSFLTNRFSISGYVCCAIANPFLKLVQVHRALASVFIPLPKELEHIPHWDLEVNHIDGIKSNLDIFNLEWITSTGNTKHALDTGLFKKGKESILTKPVKGVILKGQNAGYEFVLFGLADYKEFGFVQPNVNAVASGRNKTHRNCKFSYATEEEINSLPRGMPKEIHDTLNYLIYR